MPHIPDEHTIDIPAPRLLNKKTRHFSRWPQPASAGRRPRLAWRNQIGRKSVDLRTFIPQEPKKQNVATSIVEKQVLRKISSPVRAYPQDSQFPTKARLASSASLRVSNREKLLHDLEEIEQEHMRLQEVIGAPSAESKLPQSQYAPWTSLDNEESLAALSLFAPSSAYALRATHRPIAQHGSLIPEKRQAIASPYAVPSKKKNSLRGLTGCAVILFLSLFGVGLWQRSQGLEARVAPEVLQAYGSLEQAKADLTALHFAQASSEFSLAEEKFSDAKVATESVGGPFLVAAVAASPLPNKASSGVHLIAAGVELSRAGADVSHAAFLLTSMHQETAPGSSFPAFSEAMREFSDAQTKITLAQNDLAYVRIQDIPQEYQAQFSDSLARVNDANSIFQSVGPLSNALMTFAGMQNEKTYLLLFQNPAEIRATGGFIGTYGILKVDQGKIKSITADGVYDADGQLTVNIVPPYPIEYISTGWSMHDANWFFDFPTSAEKVVWFYEKTGGETPDGVIAVTPRLVENLLEITGPIAMPAYNVTLSADNFEDVVQQQVEVNYDKTQNRPKQILSDFMPVLFARVQDALSSRSADTAHILVRSLQQKDVLLYSRDQNVEQVFDTEGWSGRVSAPNSEGAQDIQDILGVVQSNLGGYKTDRVIRTAMQTNTTLETDGSIHRVVTITRTHQGGRSIYDWYNKQNVDYMRVYVPEGSRLIQASGFSPQPPMPAFNYQQNHFSTDELVASTGLGDRKDPASNTDIFQENGMQVFGNWLVLNPGETKTVKLEYVLPATMNTPSSYTLSLFSQAGIAPVLGVSFDVSGSGTISSCSQGSYNATSLTLQKAAFSSDTKVMCVIGR